MIKITIIVIILILLLNFIEREKWMMKDLKGTKTEANLMAAFAGESKQETNIHTMQAKQKKKAMNKLQHCS